MNDNHKCENCGKCCIETEMILSQEDIKLIINNRNLSKDQFTFLNNDGFFQLKNIEGYCIFFDISTKLCKIYKFRPQGCRFYPLIYDFQVRKCVFDEDCPRVNLFYQDKKSFSSKCEDLKFFLRNQLKLDTS